MLPGRKTLGRVCALRSHEKRAPSPSLHAIVHAIASLIPTSQSQANLKTSATAPTETVLKRRLNEETTREIDEEVRAVNMAEKRSSL